MSELKQKMKKRNRRIKRVRKRIFGTPERPRLVITRTLKHIYVQIIDDISQRTLVSCSTLSKDLRNEIKYGGNIQSAKVVGRKIGELALAKNIDKVVFDKRWYKFHGRVKALADSARETGLNF